MSSAEQLVPLSVTILAEARELLSALRRNRRFAYLLPFAATSQPADHPLVKDLKSLRDLIRTPITSTSITSSTQPPAPPPPAPPPPPATSPTSTSPSSAKPPPPPSPTPPPTSSFLIPPDALLNALEPFFQVIRSRDASGIITGVALQSLTRIARRLIHIASTLNALPPYSATLSAIVDAAAACRFDATDPAADEVVLARIARVTTTVCASPVAVPHVADASVLRAVEACLAIASGRRRASDLLKRTADTALCDIFDVVARSLPSILAQSSPSTAIVDQHTHPSHNASSSSDYPSVFAPGTGSAFGYALDVDAFPQHAPATPAVAIALLQLASRMADPYYSQSSAERALGLQLLAVFVPAGGAALCGHAVLKGVVLRDCARGVLRSLGLFKSSAVFMSYAFTVAVEIVHALREEGAVFLLALLERVFPYYISGLENVLPRVGAPVTEGGGGEGVEGGSGSGGGGGVGGNGGGAGATGGGGGGRSSPLPSGSSGSLSETAAVEIDPVVREIGLEAMADLLSIPGLLCIVYRLADCDMVRQDVVEPLLLALGHASKINGFRRRSKRLRASTSGTNRMSGAADVESDDEEVAISNGKGSPESLRFSRSSGLLCADAVLAVVDTISDRLKMETAGLAKPSFVDKEALVASRLIRVKKVRLQSAAAKFNSSEKLAKATKLLGMLREHGLVEKKKEANGTVSEDLDDDVRGIVRFIKETPGLSKEKVGSVLGEPDNVSRRVLSDYTATFDFANRPFTESLRVYLESFRLPGEAQKIDRIVQSFASRYYAQNMPNGGGGKSNLLEAAESPNISRPVESDPSEVVPLPSNTDNVKENGDVNGDVHNVSVLKSADAAYVLSFSVVMLNTDQHNESIRKKMTLEDFVKNCRGINDGEDLPKWFLSDVFDSIAAVEIRMSDEAGVGALTDLFWDEQLRIAQAFTRKFPSADESRVFDEQIFLLAWESGVVAANSILNEAGEPNSVQKALEGFLSISRCATTFKISLPTDAVISSLCTATTVRDGPLHGAVVRFGTDIKAQMASVALSGVARECGDWIRSDGWQALVAYLLRLHALCLLPVELEKRIGGYGPELIGVNKGPVPSSHLTPAWWPSQIDRRDGPEEETIPRKAPKPNGFFAAIIAASIGSEVDADDEDEDNDQGVSGGGGGRKRVSKSPPHYVRTQTREDTEARDLARKCIASCRIEDVVINEAKVLQSESLQFLCKAVAQSAFRLMETGGSVSFPENGSAEEDLIASVKEDFVLDWIDIAPLSPKGNSSIISGVLSRRGVPGAEQESDFSAFGLTPSWDGAIRERDERKAREFVISFCIDVLCELTLQNRDRLNVPWPELYGLLMRIIAPATEPSAMLERAVVALLRVGVRLLHRQEIHDDVLRGFNLLVRLPSETAEALSVPMAAGVLNIVKGHGGVIKSTSGWHAILSILESLARYNAQAREIGLETIRWILKEIQSTDAVSPETYAPLLDAILAYTSCSSVDVSIEALEMLYLLSQQPTKFSESGAAIGRLGDEDKLEEVMWSEYWGPLFLGFASSVRDPRGKVRNCALGVLERVIASGGSTEVLTAGQWQNLLSGVLLPLMRQLFSTGGYLNATLEAETDAQRRIFEERNAGGGRGRGRMFGTSTEHDEMLRKSVVAACGRTRMRGVLLNSKTFLQHHVAIAAGLAEDTFTELWIGVLEVFRVAVLGGGGEDGESMNGGDSGVDAENDDVREHVPECVKNLLLVMCDCGLLKKEQHVRWNATFTLVRSFIPDIDDVIVAATQGGDGADIAATEGGDKSVHEENRNGKVEEAAVQEKGGSSKGAAEEDAPSNIDASATGGEGETLDQRSESSSSVVVSS